MYKKRDHVQSCCFANINLLLCFRSLCRRYCHCLSSPLRLTTRGWGIGGGGGGVDERTPSLYTRSSFKFYEKYYHHLHQRLYHLLFHGHLSPSSSASSSSSSRWRWDDDVVQLWGETVFELPIPEFSTLDFKWSWLFNCWIALSTG